MSILVCGDIHGEWGKLNDLINRKNPEIILQCGDFGYWPGLSMKRPVLYNRKLKAWSHKGVKPKDTKVYWCDGNHEDHWRLAEDWKTGAVDYPGVYYRPRGSSLELPDGRVVLFMGGASSVDKAQRTLGIDWFPEELITYQEYIWALETNKRVDIVISHTCPIEFDIKHRPDKQGDPCRMALSGILEKFQPEQWFFGHWHLYKEGKYGNTRWTGLNHCSSLDTWWKEL